MMGIMRRGRQQPVSPSKGPRLLYGFSGTMNKDLASGNCVASMVHLPLAVAYCNALDPPEPLGIT